MSKNSTVLNVLLLLSYLLGFSLLVLVLGARFGRPLVLIEAKNVHIFLHILGVPNVLLGDMVYLPNERLSFEITWQCSGMFSISLYTIVYLTFPRIRRDVKGWMFAASVLYLFNLMRVVIAIYIYHRFGEYPFSFFHYTLGPAIMFGIVVSLLGGLLVKSLKNRQN
ncbi:archaeosortase family protein ArtF [Thermococcus sp.]